MLLAYTHFCWEAGGPCHKPELEVAKFLGWDAEGRSEKAQRSLVNVALHGRWMRGVWHPGVCDPARGWMSCSSDRPRSPKTPTDQWLDASHLRLRTAEPATPDRPRSTTDFTSARGQNRDDSDAGITSARRQSPPARAGTITSARRQDTIKDGRPLEDADSSSSALPESAPPDDDDDNGAAHFSGERLGIEAAAAVAEAQGWKSFAAEVRARAAEIGSGLGGRFNLYADVIRKTAGVLKADKGKDIGSMHRYCLKGAMKELPAGAAAFSKIARTPGAAEIGSDVCRKEAEIASAEESNARREAVLKGDRLKRAAKAGPPGPYPGEIQELREMIATGTLYEKNMARGRLNVLGEMDDSPPHEPGTGAAPQTPGPIPETPPDS